MEKKKFKMPHVYIILMAVMLVVVLLSYLVPSGEYGKILDETTNKMVMDVNNFNFLQEKDNIGIFDYFTAIHDGVVQSGDIVISLIIMAGVLYMYEETGTINGGIHSVLSLAKGKELFIVVFFMILFSILGTLGVAEGILPFFPLITTVIMAIGYDRVVGVAVTQLGVAAGFTAGVLNLYTTGISQRILGLPIFSGITFRIGVFIFFTFMAIVYVVYYCNKIKKDPTKSIVAKEYMMEKEKDMNKEENVAFTIQHKIALVLLMGIFIVTTYGALKLNWGFSHFSASYIILGIILSILFKISPSKTCEMISFGASRILPAALTIGIARGTMVLMSKAKIMDTCIHYLAEFLNNKNKFLVLFIIYIAVIIFNFFVISGSGKAVILMPILGPLGKILNINQQVLVLLYQYGDGITNYLWPSSGTLLVALTMCKLEYQDWVKFVWKFLLFWIVIAFAVVLFAYNINLGPF